MKEAIRVRTVTRAQRPKASERDQMAATSAKASERDRKAVRAFERGISAHPGRDSAQRLDLA